MICSCWQTTVTVPAICDSLCKAGDGYIKTRKMLITLHGMVM